MEQFKANCPSCGYVYTSGEAFCRNCGRELPTVAAKTEAQGPAQKIKHVCTRCGYNEFNAGKFCPKCGKPFSLLICPSCGAPNSIDNKACFHCSSPLLQTADEREDEYEEAGIESGEDNEPGCDNEQYEAEYDESGDSYDEEDYNGLYSSEDASIEEFDGLKLLRKKKTASIFAGIVALLAAGIGFKSANGDSTELIFWVFRHQMLVIGIAELVRSMLVLRQKDASRYYHTMITDCILGMSSSHIVCMISIGQRSSVLGKLTSSIPGTYKLILALMIIVPIIVFIVDLCILVSTAKKLRSK